MVCKNSIFIAVSIKKSMIESALYKVELGNKTKMIEWKYKKDKYFRKNKQKMLMIVTSAGCRAHKERCSKSTGRSIRRRLPRRADHSIYRFLCQ